MTNKSLINIDGDFSTRPPALEKGDLCQLLPFKRSIVGSVFLGALLPIIVVHLTIIFGGFLTMTFVNTAISHSLASSLR